MSTAAEMGGACPAAPTAAAWIFDLRSLGDLLMSEQDREPRLSDAELVRATEIKDPQRRARWVGTRIALRCAIEKWMGHSIARCPFEIAAGGKPFLPPPVPSFSLSHAGDFALVLMSSAGPVGADMEAIADRKIAEVRRGEMEAFALALAAGAPLPLASASQRFIQAWCRIEAFAKADGRGVARVLAEAGILGPGSRAARARPSDGGTALHLSTPTSCRAFDLQLGNFAPGFAAAVAGPPETSLAGLSVTDGATLLPIRP